MPLTPMMRQYLDIKEQHPDAILFFRLGEFYEMFFDDARLVSKELELVLTGKDCGLAERAPMCGIPCRTADSYLQRLIEKGYKVAICEQMEDPATARGLVDRDVIRIVTPGTVIESSMLEEGRPNYICSVCVKKNQAGIAFCDVSTGEFNLCQIRDVRAQLADELARIHPSETIANDTELVPGASIMPEDSFAHATAAKVMAAHFGASLRDLGFEDQRLAVCAAGALLKYLTDTQKNALGHIVTPRAYAASSGLALDRTALRNLELTQTVLGKGKRGSLLWVLDRCRTAMGSRLLRSWIERPLRDRTEIEARLDAVDQFKGDPMNAGEMREVLDEVYDVERLLGRIAYDAVNPRECLSLARTLQVIPRFKHAGAAFDAPMIRHTVEALNELPELRETLIRAIDPEAPVSLRDGGIIRRGYSEALDQLKDISENGQGYIAAIEARERERTGIKNLKVGYNRVFGYFIEVTKSYLNLVPYDYVRKQTLANCERYITEELKTLEGRILGAQENAIRLEYELFCALREQLKAALPALQETVNALKTLDVLLSLAQVASENGYTRPRINDEGRYQIQNGRHPVVEASLGREQFVPNDTDLNDRERIMIITGANMAGKSTYMRQVALIVLLAHMGSFVPADSADIALTDRIFTRIGASDDLYGGQSTFMVEMSEMATILKFATPRSLLILDEVGRGTSTFDGLAIAWAAVEYIASEKCGARTLFATHYHELSELEGKLDGVVNFRATAREQGEDVIFLRKIVRGGADRSFGVSVARLAGLPKPLITRAQQIMAKLAVDDQQRGNLGQNILKEHRGKDKQLGLMDFEANAFAQEIAQLDVVGMTPLEALNKLFELNEKAKRI